MRACRLNPFPSSAFDCRRRISRSISDLSQFQIQNGGERSTPVRERKRNDSDLKVRKRKSTIVNEDFDDRCTCMWSLSV